MDMDLQGKVAVVTGGSSGIGLATVELFLAEGMRVAFCGRNQDRLDQARERLSARYPAENIMAFSADVVREDSVEKFALKVERTFGAVDVLINNAGGGRLSTFETTLDESWTEELNLKFFSVIYPTRHFLGLLEKSEAPAIVVVNSLLALQPEPHMVATSAARAGLLNMVRSMATEFAPKGIRVNSILLGTIASGQWERRYKERAAEGISYEEWLTELARQKNITLGRFGKPEEPARAIVFLASSAASYTTGSAIDVSGGIARHI
ncbi:MAG: short chain dehydrogenase [Alphaproteobacteria bacterium]|nr:MAG: short chain dehydrogenase [Alphaproteobacteria bacterium]